MRSPRTSTLADPTEPVAAAPLAEPPTPPGASTKAPRAPGKPPEKQVRAGQPTAKQRLAYEMKKSGHSWSEIAAALNVSKITARNYVGRAEHSGMPRVTRDKRRERSTRALETEPIGAALADAADPLAIDMTKVREVAEHSGMPKQMIEGLLRRVRANYAPVIAEVQRLRGDALAARIEEKIELALQFMDETSFASAPLKDVGYVLNVLISNHQLLQGKPTQIYDITTRKKLETMMPAMLAEARRRGITVEGEFAHVVATPELPVAATDHTDRHSGSGADDSERNAVDAANVGAIQLERGEQPVDVGHAGAQLEGALAGPGNLDGSADGTELAPAHAPEVAAGD